MRVYATDLDGVLTDTQRQTQIAQELFDLETITVNTKVMNDWVFAGLVPSLFTMRPPTLRAVTEAWCAKNNVPYSNFLLGVDDFMVGELLYHVDADFYITANEIFAVETLNSGVKTYMVRRDWNVESETLLVNEFEHVKFVNDLREITTLEGI